MGAIAEGGIVLFNEDVLAQAAPPQTRSIASSARSAASSSGAWRSTAAGRPAVPIAGRVAIVVDDGLATGATMEAAVRAVQARGVARVVVAVPVAAREACDRLRVASPTRWSPARTPSPFYAVGAWYLDFDSDR